MDNLLKRSVEESRPVEIIYASEKGLMTKRTILIYKADEEWVTGYCFLRRGVRKFRRRNILSIFPRNS